jgi:hypothetical protein
MTFRTGTPLTATVNGVYNTNYQSSSYAILAPGATMPLDHFTVDSSGLPSIFANNSAAALLFATMRSAEWHHIWHSKRKPCNPNNTHLGAITDNPSLTSIQKVTGLSLCIKTLKY